MRRTFDAFPAHRARFGLMVRRVPVGARHDAVLADDAAAVVLNKVDGAHC